MSCQVCGKNYQQPKSVWCGLSCRYSGKPGSQNEEYTKGIPLCQICSEFAFCSRGLYAPGCNRDHAQIARGQGLYEPR